MDYISEKIAKKVLTIGAPYKNYKGGIGAVIAVYQKYFTPFKFIASYSYGNIIHILGRYVVCICRLFITLLKDREIKIVHLHSASRGSFLRKSIIFLIVKIFRKKVVFHVHGGAFHLFYGQSRFKPCIRYIFRKADLIICLSEEWRKFYSTNFECKRLEILHNVIEYPSLRAEITKENLTINLLFLGRVSNAKGIFDLLNILLKNQDLFSSKIKLVIGGDGEIERLESFIKNNSLESWISYAGWVSADKKHQLLADCDVYVLPSYYEGLPISILEAMSYGKPVMSTNVGGIPQIVKSGINGWVHDPGDLTQIFSILEDLINNQDQLSKYGKNSLDLVRPYLPSHVFGYLNTLYTDLLNESSTNKRPA